MLHDHVKLACQAFEGCQDPVYRKRKGKKGGLKRLLFAQLTNGGRQRSRQAQGTARFRTPSAKPRAPNWQVGQGRFPPSKCSIEWIPHVVARQKQGTFVYNVSEIPLRRGHIPNTPHWLGKRVKWVEGTSIFGAVETRKNPQSPLPSISFSFLVFFLQTKSILKWAVVYADKGSWRLEIICCKVSTSDQTQLLGFCSGASKEVQMFRLEWYLHLWNMFPATQGMYYEFTAWFAPGGSQHAKCNGIRKGFSTWKGFPTRCMQMLNLRISGYIGLREIWRSWCWDWLPGCFPAYDLPSLLPCPLNFNVLFCCAGNIDFLRLFQSSCGPVHQVSQLKKLRSPPVACC